TTAYRQSGEQHVHDGDAVSLRGGCPHATRSLEVRCGFVETPLIGEDLAHVAVRVRGIARHASPLAALARPPIERDRVAPAAVPICERAEVGQDRGLMLGVSEALVDLQRAPGVRGIVGAT